MNAVNEIYNLKQRLCLTPEEQEFLKVQHEYGSVVKIAKRCNKCGKLKPVSEFYKHALKRGGVFDTCKKCVLERKKELHAKLKCNRC